MSRSIFSRYSQGENRVTASILEVMRSLSVSRLERLLGTILEDTNFELIQFVNQPSNQADSVPDARISAHFRLDIETKVKSNSINLNQLRTHLGALGKPEGQHAWLLVLTPDKEQPPQLADLKDKRLIWKSFANLDSGIEEILSDDKEVTSEREAFLLRELQQMFIAERLLDSPNEVLVVPARSAWPEYERYRAYICQPNRTFQDVSHLAFYADGEIKPIIPKIVKINDEVIMDPDRVSDPDFQELVRKIVAHQAREHGASNKIFLLSAPGDSGTIELAAPIKNDTKAKSGRIVAFTQNQRYVSRARLESSKTTTELIRPETAS